MKNKKYVECKGLHRCGCGNLAVYKLEHRLSWYDDQLTKAKDIIKELVKGIRITFEHKGFITDVDAFLLKAEQFLKESE